MSPAVIEVPEHFIVADLDVAVWIRHSNVFDLQLFLEDPSGVRLRLNWYQASDEFFKGVDYAGTVFDDEAELAIEQGSAPFRGRFRPRGDPLAIFDGRDAYGLWKLEIYDAYYGDTGVLERLELSFAVAVPEPGGAAVLALGVVLGRLVVGVGRAGPG